MAKPAGFQPAVFYPDAKAAIAWLERAFGFEKAIYIEGDDGSFVHCQMQWGEGLVSIAQAQAEGDFKAPGGLGGANTQATSIHVETDVDGHCARARAAGAEILREPADQFYGARSYECRDFAGHHWFVSAPVEEVTREQALERLGGGVRIEGWV